MNFPDAEVACIGVFTIGFSSIPEQDAMQVQRCVCMSNRCGSIKFIKHYFLDIKQYFFFSLVINQH